MRLRLRFKLSEPLLIALLILCITALALPIFMMGGSFYSVLDACSLYSPSDMIRCIDCNDASESLRWIG